MELLGQPFTIQNTSQGWLVDWPQAVMHGTADDPSRERVSFTVLIPRNASLTIEQVQTFALKRAEELLQAMIRARGERLSGQ